jgi:hypothetical protein
MWDADVRTITLQPARPMGRVLWGIGTAFAVSAVMVVAFAIEPAVSRRHVSELESVVIFGLLGALIYAVQRRVAGPPLLLEIDETELRLVVARDRRLLAAAPLDGVVITRAVHHTRHGRYRGYVIVFSGRRLSLGVNGGEGPDVNAPEISDPTHWIDPEVAECISELAPRGKAASSPARSSN